MSIRSGYWIALLLIMVAAVFRLAQLADLPAGLQASELRTIRLMETARRGTITILFEDADGRGTEMLGPTALALTSAFSGAGPFALRWSMALLSLVMLALVYTLAVRLFGRFAGLASLSLLALTFWPSLLARNILIESMLPLLVVVVMLALARAVPVYRVAREESATTTAFATLGAAVGISFYLHPVGLLVGMAAMVFILYALWIRRPIERQRLSYIGFSVLIVLILTIPYLVFSVNRPGLGASSRLIGDYTAITSSVVDGISALFWQGDVNAAQNVPLRPLFDPISALIILGGAIASLWYIRYPRYVLVLTFLVVLAPAALLASQSPNNLGLTVWLVPLSLFFGAGFHILMTRTSPRIRPVLFAASAVLALFNIVWTATDLFTTWPAHPQVQQAYETDLHQLARFLDREMGTIPNVICYPQVNTTAVGRQLNATQRMVLMMNRRPWQGLRFIDCNTAMIFPRGGDAYNVIMVEPNAVSTMHPYIQRWLEYGEALDHEDLPTGRVVTMQVGAPLADQLGVFTTTVTADYGFEAAQPTNGILPPIRFGGNITWLGYEPDTNRRYRPGDTLDVINYWRIESGAVPPDLQFFTHVLSDSVTVADNRDMISVDVSYLRERDVFVQVVPIQLRSNLLSGQYLISVGAYQEQTLARLPVFDNEQVRQGDRIILYTVEIGE